MARSLYAHLARRYSPQPTGLERREFLKTTLAASAGLLLSSLSGFGESSGQRQVGRGRRVIVIGGGYAGLTCAHELTSAGYHVTVLESRNRVGGRVISFGDMVKGKVVEGGGELIGSNHPTWVAYASKFGLRFSDVTENEDLDFPLILDGKRLTDKESEALWEEIETSYKLMAADARPINADEPWKSPYAERLDHRSTADWVRTLQVSKLGKRALTTELSADNGVSTSRQSYLGNLTQVKAGGLEKYWTHSEVYRCRGGNERLTQKLAGAIGEKRLRRNSVVREITMRDDKVIVRCANGELHEADDVVLTAPPSTWHNIRFSPRLPRALRPQMGTAVKYLGAVQGRFWEKAGAGADSMTDGMVSMTWDGTDDQGSDAQGAVLMAFSGGPAAKRSRARWARERDEAYLEELTEIYPGFRSNFVRGRFMDWPGEMWTGAGYSFPAPGQVTTVGPLLRAGMGRLHFAGEHTCYKFVGYMEGALNSGVSVARRIAKRDRRSTAASTAETRA